MAIRTRICEVAVGESLDNMQRENVSVDLSAQTTLYSGRIFHKDAGGLAVEGLTGPSVPAYIAHRGVECADVKGSGAIQSSATGSLLGTSSGYGVISGILMQPGLVVVTSEYDTTPTYAVNDGVTVVTGSGQWRKATGATNNEVLGIVIAEGSSVNVAYASTRNTVKIRLIRQGISL